MQISVISLCKFQAIHCADFKDSFLANPLAPSAFYSPLPPLLAPPASSRYVAHSATPRRTPSSPHTPPSAPISAPPPLFASTPISPPQRLKNTTSTMSSPIGIPNRRQHKFHHQRYTSRTQAASIGMTCTTHASMPCAATVTWWHSPPNPITTYPKAPPRM